MKYIGIDIGTSSICGVRYDATSGESVALTKANPSNIATAEAWAFQQDANQILSTVKSLLDELMTDEVTAIGFSGQMHGMLYVDDEGRAVSPLYTWQDGSGDQPFCDGMSYAGWLTQQTGYQVSTGYGLTTHFYHLQQGTVPVEARALCTVMDFVTMNLCGSKRPLCEPSNAASLGLFDKQRLCFDAEALRRSGIDPVMLPTVVSADTTVGTYKTDGRELPVFVAIGDNQASFLGSVDKREESVLVTIGTSSQLSVFTPQYVEVDGLDTRPLPGGGYILVGAALCGGCSLAMLKDFFSQTVEQFGGQKITDDKIYDLMFTDRPAKDTALKVETTFEGTRLDPTRRGSITGISLRNFTPETLVEGFLHGVCDELHDFYSALPASIREGRTTLVGSGNALRRNGRLRDVLSDTFALPLALTQNAEEAAMGAARNAAYNTK